MRRPFEEAGLDPAEVFYFAESVLDPDYRGRGIGHRFFDEREAHARSLGCSTAAFCAVIRPDDHPMRPEDYSPLDPFWTKRGYRKLNGGGRLFSMAGCGRDTGDGKADADLDRRSVTADPWQKDPRLGDL
ncbi:GNAT family N-acetyltransferase [uncultured Roseibium sp.]|uniref:GNAT family N-acetyltransferase n=1 Tax=uncultured Roseibium sp. TaxID=1936171 RepID=UPI00374A0630